MCSEVEKSTPVFRGIPQQISRFARNGSGLDAVARMEVEMTLYNHFHNNFQEESRE
jgi:hypothetical protein